MSNINHHSATSTLVRSLIVVNLVDEVGYLSPQINAIVNRRLANMTYEHMTKFLDVHGYELNREGYWSLKPISLGVNPARPSDPLGQCYSGSFEELISEINTNQ